MNLRHAGRYRLGMTGAGIAGAALAGAATFGPAAAQAATPVSHPSAGAVHASSLAVASKATRHTRARVTEIPWGTANGQPVELYTLHGAGGMKVNISEYGADTQAIDVPNRQGRLTDVVLGFPRLSDYVNDFQQGAEKTNWPIASSTSGSGDVYFGGTIGQYANRIANGRFSLNGKTYQVDTNNGPNGLHGGYLGWNTKVWSGTPRVSGSTASVTMSASFPAGSGCILSLTPGCTGYPTAVNASVTFSVRKDNTFAISYSATNDSPSLATVVNLTNHSYYNLGGQNSGTVYDQLLALNSNTYQPTNSTQIPEAGSNGSYFQKVAGTAFDFRRMHSIGENINNLRLPDGTSGPIRQLQYAHGYDFNWVLNNQRRYRLDAVAQDLKTGITLWQYTDQPGLQVYTANYLVGDLDGVTGDAYRQGDAFTLETQHYPDSPNHIGQAGWPSVVLGAGQTFRTNTAMHFGIEGASFAKRIHFR